MQLSELSCHVYEIIFIKSGMVTLYQRDISAVMAFTFSRMNKTPVVKVTSAILNKKFPMGSQSDCTCIGRMERR